MSTEQVTSATYIVFLRVNFGLTALSLFALLFVAQNVHFDVLFPVSNDRLYSEHEQVH